MTIKERFEAIHAQLDEVLELLRAQQQQQSQSTPSESPRDVLTLDEAAKHLGIKPSTLRNRKAGTAGIPRYSDRPVKFLRASLDQFKRARVEANARRAQEPKAKLSLVRRKKAS